MKSIVAAIGLSLCLTSVASVASAQQSGTVIVRDADGTAATSTSGLHPTANGEGSTIVYGDINTGNRTVISPPTVSQGPAAPAPAPAPAPVDDSASAAPADAGPSAPESTGTVAAEGDLDGDNYPDAAEPDLGLDPTNPDTDGDNVADGDEITIYGTDPLNPDTDGDGRTDGEELFATHTDPLVWDDFSGDAAAAP